MIASRLASSVLVQYPFVAGSVLAVHKAASRLRDVAVKLAWVYDRGLCETGGCPTSTIRSTGGAGSTRSHLAIITVEQSFWGYPQQMLRRSISVMLAGLLIVAAVYIFVLMSGSVAVVAAAAFCLIAGVVWLYGELSDDLRRGQ
jgi:hypothetical protein